MKDSPGTQRTTEDDLEEIEVACAIFDDTGCLISCDENFRNLYHYSEVDTASGVHYSVLDKLDLERGVILLGDEEGAGKEYLNRREAYRKNHIGSFTFQLKDKRWVKITDRPLTTGGFVSIQQDITAKRLAEDELFRTNKLFKTAFHLNNNVCTISVLETGLFLDINDTWLNTFGFEREEVIGKTTFQLNPWGEPENRHNFVEILRKDGHVVEYEAVLRTRSGEFRDMIASASILEVGGVECLFFSAHDVTEIKRAERAIKLSEKRFRTIFENAPIGMALYNNKNNKVQFANKRFLEIIDRKEEEVKILDWKIITHPDDIQISIDTMHDLKDGNFPLNQIVKRYVRPDGSIVWAEVSVISIETGDPNQPVQHLSMIEDISEKREIEFALNYSREQFADFTLASADWYWEINQNNLFSFVSKVVSERTGVQSMDYLGHTVQEVMGDNYIQQDTLDTMFNSLDQRKSFRDIVYWRKHHLTGKKVWIRASGAPFYDKDGAFKGFRGVSSEVTEQKILEDKLQQSQKMESVGQLTGGIAHDFNNLLAVIVGNAELLKDTLSTGNEIDDNQVDAILRAGERGAELTQSMLAFSRKQDLQPRILQLDIHVQTMISLLRRTLGETIEIVVESEENLWPCKADPGKVENALLNMAINARDAMPDGGVLTIGLKNVVLGPDYAADHAEIAEGKYIMMSVSDTGTGIDMETLHHVFEPFYTTKDIGKGTGLGLSMVYGFAQQSKGQVTISSEAGRGTTLKLYLPQSSQPAVMPVHERVKPNTPAEGTILVVEEDQDVRAFTTSLLESLGYQVRNAKDGMEALSMLDKEETIDLLLTDTVLPGRMSGLDLVGTARKIRKNLNILYMSGYSEDVVSSSPSQQDKAILLQKPFHKAELAEKVRLALGR